MTQIQLLEIVPQSCLLPYLGRYFSHEMENGFLSFR